MFWAIFRSTFGESFFGHFSELIELNGIWKKIWFFAPRPTNEVYILSGSGNFIKFDTIENI
jgi:hypothetical protein